jgi:hypothetical protein
LRFWRPIGRYGAPQDIVLPLVLVIFVGGPVLAIVEGKWSEIIFWVVFWVFLLACKR